MALSPHMIWKPPISLISTVRLPTLIHSLTTSQPQFSQHLGHAKPFPPQSICILFSMTFPERHIPAPPCHADIGLNVISSKNPDLTHRHTDTCRHRHTRTHTHTPRAHTRTHTFSLSFTSETCSLTPTATTSFVALQPINPHHLFTEGVKCY